MDNVEIGRVGEDIAEYFLRKKGYEIIERNYRKRFGEIDIIANDRNCTVFVEVKTRSSIQFGYPSQAVDSRKIQRIMKTANCYIAQNGIFEGEFRFDVIEVYIASKKINHIEGAF